MPKSDAVSLEDLLAQQTGSAVSVAVPAQPGAAGPDEMDSAPDGELELEDGDEQEFGLGANDAGSGPEMDGQGPDLDASSGLGIPAVLPSQPAPPVAVQPASPVAVPPATATIAPVAGDSANQDEDMDVSSVMTPQEVPGRLEYLPIASLVDAEYNREVGDLGDMVESIKNAGILEPLVVCTTNTEGMYLVIAGHRRKAASLLAGLTQVPCVIREVSSAAERLALMLIENLHRKDLSPLEEARGYQRVLDAGLAGGQRALAKLVGVSQPIISKRLSLLRLPQEAQQALDSGRVTLEQAADLQKLPPIKILELVAGTGPVNSRDINMAVRSYERAERAAMRRAQLTAKGLRVITAEPSNDPDHGPYPVYWLVSAGRLTREQANQHVNLPCHAVYVRDDEQELELCTVPANHPYPQGTKPAPGTEHKDSALASGARRALAVQLARDTVDDTQFDIALLRACLLYHDPGLSTVLAESADQDGGPDLVALALEGDAKASGKPVRQGLHWLALAAAERIVTARKDGSFNTSPPAIQVTQRYMEYLHASGYTPSWWDRELMEAVAKKRAPEDTEATAAT